MTRKRVGPKQIVRIIRADELAENGGKYLVSGKVATPIVVETNPRHAVGGPISNRVYIVTDAEIASGKYNIEGGSAQIVVDSNLFTLSPRKVGGGRDVAPVYIMDGSLPLDYYVDASSGNDSSDGLRPNSAWQTVGKVNSETFLPSERVLFKRGETWRETLTVPSSGSADRPIIFGAYGSGNKPIINGADVMLTWTSYAGNTWQKTGVTEESFQVFMDDVRLTEGADRDSLNDHEWVWAADVLYVRDETGDPDGSGVVLEASQRWINIDLNNDDYITINGLDVKFSNQRGIGLRNGASSIIIQNTTAQYNFWSGIDCNDVVAASDTVTIDGCTTRYNGESGISPGRYGTNWLIQNNDCQYDNQAEGTEAGIKAYGANSGGHIIQNNTCKNAAASGYGIWIDQVPTACIVRYNLCQDNEEGQIYIEKSSDCEVYYNLCIGSGASENGIELSGTNAEPVDGTLVYNNVCYNNGNQNIVVRGNGADSITNNLIKNNIAVVGATYNLSAKGGGENDGTNGSGNVYTYNCLDAEFGNFIQWADGVYKSTYDDWETAYGATTNSIEADPLMTNPGSDDFTLQSGSPCRNAGADVSLTTDYAGVSVPQETNPAIGAYEYIG